MSSKEPIRVLLVDHDGVVRRGFRVIIDNAPGMVAVGETASVDDAVTLADEVRPDVVLFEINVARRGFDDLIGKLRARSGDLCQVICVR